MSYITNTTYLFAKEYKIDDNFSIIAIGNITINPDNTTLTLIINIQNTYLKIKNTNTYYINITPIFLNKIYKKQTKKYNIIYDMLSNITTFTFFINLKNENYIKNELNNIDEIIKNDIKQTFNKYKKQILSTIFILQNYNTINISAEELNMLCNINNQEYL